MTTNTIEHGLGRILCDGSKTVDEFNEACAELAELERKAAAFDAIEQELEQAKADVENLSKDNIALRSQLFGSHFSHRDHVDAIRAELEPRETAYPATLRYWGFKALQLAMDLGVRYDAERDRAEKAERERDELRELAWSWCFRADHEAQFRAETRANLSVQQHKQEDELRRCISLHKDAIQKMLQAAGIDSEDEEVVLARLSELREAEANDKHAADLLANAHAAHTGACAKLDSATRERDEQRARADALQARLDALMVKKPKPDRSGGETARSVAHSWSSDESCLDTSNKNHAAWAEIYDACVKHHLRAVEQERAEVQAWLEST